MISFFFSSVVGGGEGEIFQISKFFFFLKQKIYASMSDRWINRRHFKVLTIKNVISCRDSRQHISIRFIKQVIFKC